jgi:RimJ/RimL family protein N-acetyltransferase
VAWRMESERLVIRPVVEEDLPEMLPIYQTNPFYLQQTMENGQYSLEDLQKDLREVRAAAGRHFLVACLRDGGQAIGAIELLEENPSDGLPWIGLLMIHASFHRKGLATECFRLVANHGNVVLAWKHLRIGVLAGNAPALTFWRGIGFVMVDEVRMEFAGRETSVYRLDFEIDARSSL